MIGDKPFIKQMACLLQAAISDSLRVGWGQATGGSGASVWIPSNLDTGLQEKRWTSCCISVLFPCDLIEISALYALLRTGATSEGTVAVRRERGDFA
jgi:hypothetical protein